MKNKIVITIIVAIFMVAMIMLANKNNASDGLERSTSADNVISQAESSIEEAENGQLDSTESEYKDNAETKEEAFYESENNNSMVDNDANTNNENDKVVEEETVDEGEGKRHELPIG